MGRVHTHYDTLKVARDAPPEVIRSAYRALARKYHPDSNPDLEEAVKAMQAINQAFEVLIDPVQRKAHDEWIDQQMGGQAAKTSSQQGRGAGVFSARNRRKGHAPESPLAGQLWPKWAKADKLTPGTAMLILALAAASIALLVIALAGQAKPPSKTAAPSEATPTLTPTPTPTTTTTPTPAPTPTPTPTPPPTPRATMTPAPTPSPNRADILKDGPQLFPGIANSWILKHNLDYTDAYLPEKDTDADGFTNREEFKAKTDPQDAASKPQPWTKLRLAGIRFEKLRVKFMSLPYGSLNEISINSLSAENPAQLVGSTRFYRKNDMIVLTETGVDGKEVDQPTPLKFQRVDLREQFNPTTNTEEEVPVAVLLNTADDKEIFLRMGQVMDSPYPVATLKDTRGGGKEYILRPGETFSLDPERSYRLVEVTEDSAFIQDLASSEQLVVPRAKPSEVVGPTPTVKPTPIASPTSAAANIGESNKFGGSVLQFSLGLLFLSPNGQCWVVAEETGFVVYSNNWTPINADSIRWSAGTAEHTIRIDGDRFYGRRDDGWTFSGKVFRP